MSEQQNIPNWWPDHPGIYDIDKTYLENAVEGPFFDGALPKRQWPNKQQWIDFLGIPVASRIGVPAGPLLNARWTTLAAQLGFDVVTYKTLRSQEHPGHGLPNIVFVDTEGDLTYDRFDQTIHANPNPPRSLNELAITNSFGMPSRNEEFLHRDIQEAQGALKPGQALVVSVVGTPGKGIDFVADFVAAARIAQNAGAKIIEANFSCPNVTTGEGCTYNSPTAFHETATALVKALGATPLIIKMGLIDDEQLLEEILLIAARGGVRAISAINTVKMKVVNEKGEPALGPGRLASGVCGGPIRAVALDLICKVRRIIDKHKLDLTLIGVGGIMLPEHIDDFLNAGADFAQSATGMMWDPYLAMRYHTANKKEPSYA